MKTAIVYYSLNGNTEQTANKIAEKIGADLMLNFSGAEKVW